MPHPPRITARLLFDKPTPYASDGLRRLARLHIYTCIYLQTGVGSTAQVQRETKYFCADTDNTWSGSSGQNWRTFGGGQPCTNGTRVDAPTEADRAVIVSGKTCNIASNAAADSLDVESGATLNIEGAAGNSLTLDDDAVSGTTINGTLNLLGANLDNSRV